MFEPVIPLIFGAMIALFAVAAALRPISTDANSFYV